MARRGESSRPAHEENWSPPDFGGQRRTRIGASIIEQFVAGHDPGDVLRELVQNEFDGGGDSLDVTFGADALNVVGNGRGITTDGWKRLSVIVGTGRVVGDDQGDRVAAKINGIGSKNFGLRSLFLFGDEIFVRSGGHVCVLDLRTLETGRVRDTAWWHGKGVRLRVPFRQEPFETLEPFTVEREAKAFNVMADGMLATLVKLALSGRRPGLRELTLRSTRSGRSLAWRQNAERVRSPDNNLLIVRRTGKLVDSHERGRRRRDFEEIEFAEPVPIPDLYAGRAYPAYFNSATGGINIAVSVPIVRRHLDPSRHGHFYYPLQTPDARTGCLVSLSAPFELDNDRTSLIDNKWNEWLIDEGARLTVELLSRDWFDRFGPEAFLAVDTTGPTQPPRFIEEVKRRLREEPCWPTQDAGSKRFAMASQIVVVTDAPLEGFLSSSHNLDPALAKDPIARRLAVAAGASSFSLSSLVRLRCAGKDSKRLKTKPGKGEANWSYENYEVALRDETRQVAMATALTTLSRRLSSDNRFDLRTTASTLTASGDLRPAGELILVPPEIWDICPEPLENRLHPSLTTQRAIASLCRTFDEQNWMAEAADRAFTGTVDEAELDALYARLLDPNAHLGRRALASIRRAPVTKNQRGEWIAPEDMVSLKGEIGKLIGSAVNIPAKELAARSDLLAKLRIRTRLDTRDLVTSAAHIATHPEGVERFERLLANNQRLVTSAAAKQLFNVPFLRAKSGVLAAPQSLHMDSPSNRLCIVDDDRLVAGSNESLYRLLGVREHPMVDTLIEIVTNARNRSEPPAHSSFMYPGIVAGLLRERRHKSEFEDEPILWVDGDYHTPSEVLVGTHIPHVFDGVVPVHRRSDDLARAFVALGANQAAGNDHWATFFHHACDQWDGEPLASHHRHRLLQAYQLRGHEGLPDGLDELTCLLARSGLLYSLDALHSGILVENDYPALAEALMANDFPIGVVLISAEN